MSSDGCKPEEANLGRGSARQLEGRALVSGFDAHPRRLKFEQMRRLGCDAWVRAKHASVVGGLKWPPCSSEAAHNYATFQTKQIIDISFYFPLSLTETHEQHADSA